MKLEHLTPDEANAVRRIARRCGCTIEETSRGRWWWRTWDITVSGAPGAMERFTDMLAAHREDMEWFRAIR